MAQGRPRGKRWVNGGRLPIAGRPGRGNDVLAEAAHREVRNLVVLTGDRHTHQALDLKTDSADPDSATVGSELVGTSISSDGDGSEITPEGRAGLRADPHLKFVNSRRGHVRAKVNQRELRADFRVLPSVSRPGGIGQHPGQLCRRGRAGGNTPRVTGRRRSDPKSRLF